MKDPKTGKFVKGTSGPKSKEWKEMMRVKMLGKNLGKVKKGIALANIRNGHVRGEKHPLWKGGITTLNESIRKSLEYRLWRIAIFERDNYTCVWCGIRGGDLNADHIKPFSLYPELRFAIDNGRTLCVPCHRTTDTYGRGSWIKK